MKTLSILLAAIPFAALANANPVPVRNPFWPIGYEGTRQTISAEPRVDVKPASAADETDTRTAMQAATARVEAEESASTRQWAAARKSLKIGGTVSVRDANGAKRTSVVINGKTYGDGDYLSVTHRERRFTWRVVGLTDNGTLRLVRVRTRSEKKDDDNTNDAKGLRK